MTICKGIPAQIGLLRSRVSLWSHNPFWARPYQHISFPFTQTAGAEITHEPNKTDSDAPLRNDNEQKRNVVFQFGNAFLKPDQRRFSNFMATKKASPDNPNVELLDIVKGLRATNDITDYLPGGNIYKTIGVDSTEFSAGSTIFPHLLWIYDGSDIYDTKVLHPSEYASAISTLTNEEIDTQQMAEDAAELIAAQTGSAIWDMNTENNPQAQHQVITIFPVMVGRRKCDQCEQPIHWTVRKYTELLQGQDFFINFKKIDSSSGSTAMFTDNPIQELNDNKMKAYANGMNTPFNPFFSPAWKGFPTAADTNNIFPDPNYWENGVSNEPFFAEIDSSNQKTIKDLHNHIKTYYLKNKAYVIIEMGEGQWTYPPEANLKVSGVSKKISDGRGSHNYFIELVEGRNPRFLHLGYEIRGFTGKGFDEEIIAEKAVKTAPRLKIRKLSEFDKISVDGLFEKGEFTIEVRQHLDDLVITFSGYENVPWRISRTDMKMDTSVNDIVYRRAPMVIPKGTLKIHGGNMTIGFRYGPLLYTKSGQVIFRDRQADIGNDSGKLEDKNVYATFARCGDNDKSKTSANKTKKAGLFKDKQFDNLKMGYDTDAYTLSEIHKNTAKTVNAYKIFNINYKRIGREYAFMEDPNLLDIELPTLEIGVVRNAKAQGGVDYEDGDIPTVLTGKTFNLGGLKEEIMGPDGKHVGIWDVAINFTAGDLILPKTLLITKNEQNIVVSLTKTTDGNEISDGENYRLTGCVTPIATAWSLIILGGGKVIKKEMTIDISEFVSSIGDGWSTEGYSSINHETKLELYLPVSTGSAAGDEKVAYILSLIDKAFYVTIAYWWQAGMGVDYPIQTASEGWSGLLPDDDPRLIQMTGIAYGADVQRSVNKIKMTVEVKDYMEVLKQTFVWNCPFFDSVSDTAAVYELAKMAGLDNDPTTDNNVPGQQVTGGIDRRTLGFLRELMGTTVTGIKDPVIYNEEKHIHDYFALPGTYADINDPAMKFPNGTPYKDIMERIIKLYGKTIYFDRYGVLIIEISPAKLTAFKNINVDPNNPDAPNFDVDVQELIKAAFVTSPTNQIWDVPTMQFRIFNSVIDAPFIVYNTVSFKRAVADAINHISMYAVSAPDSGVTGFMAKGRTFYEQIWEPESEAFFGYRKMMWHQDGIYGDNDSMNQAMSFYARFKYPPYAVRFETYGMPGLKPLDVIIIDGQPLYITEINHDLDPSNNNWWMTVNAEWIKSFDEKLLFPETSDVDIENPIA